MVEYNKEYMSVEKTKRNKRIYQMWKASQKLSKEERLSYRQLGKIFDLNVRAVFDIVKRYKRC